MAAFEDVETFAFQSEIAQLMSHVVNTSYSNKEIFLRELVSNASNALDRIRHESINNSFALKSGRDFCIKIIPDPEKNTLTIIDTGIGMTKSDLVNLGTIANSGTKAFLGILKTNVDANMIGQIGIGFYSVYLVANKVTIVSKHNSDKQYTWESVVGGSFTIRSDPGEPLGRGTKIVLHIKENRTEFLQQEKITSIIKKHSQFVCYPIKLVIENIHIKEVSDNEAEDEDNDNGYDEKNKKKKKIVKEKFFVQQVLNKTKPIWTCNLDDISQDEFSDLYKFLTNDWETYLAVKHICLDGQLTFQALLFVPNQAPLDMYKKKNNIHIYICHVFIMDNCEDIMPEYLSFVKGILDTESLPLNISREKLQQSNILKVIKKILVTKCFEMFNDLAKDKIKYMMFYKQFSKNLKIGIHQDSDNKIKLFNLLRYYTSLSGNEACSLKDYVTRMKQNQTQIYYITGENRNQVANSVFIERLKKCGYEVIYMTEPMDEYVLDLMETYGGKDLVSAAKEGLDLPETDEEKIKRKNDQTEFEQFCKFVKEILGKKVENVVISNRLVESPCCIVTQKQGWTANMERIMKAEALHSMPTESHTVSKKILEINPDHQIINKLKQKVEANSNDKAVRDLIIFLFETSLMSSGFELIDPHFITSKIHKLIAFGLNIGEDLPVIEARFTNVEPTPVEHDAENISCMEELD